LPKLAKPMVALGVSEKGVDFDAPDGKPARLIFLVLTPRADGEAQLELLSSIGKTFRRPNIRAQALKTKNLTELIALIKIESRG
jgi:mannitol/fructose-specific phosphotransferase system IIA component (Ntr-type)